MSNIKICDICEKQTIDNKRYEIIQHTLFGKCKLDICDDCIQEIKQQIKHKKESDNNA